MMTYAKPILAVSSFGLGAALLLLAVEIQRDPFAFTSQKAQIEEALSSVTFVVPPPVTLQPAAIVEEIPVVELEALEVLPAKPAAPKRLKPAAAPKSVEPAQPPCNPVWRELESGPAGGRVREICPPTAPGDVPRS